MNYEQLRQKYNLPDLEILYYEFEIEKDSEFILREIRRKMNEKLDAYCDVLNGILQPEATNMSQMHEVSYFDEKDKNKVYKFYKKLMQLSRLSTQVGLEGEEEKEADFIRSVFKEWKSIKDMMIWILELLKESWIKDSKSEQDLRYMG